MFTDTILSRWSPREYSAKTINDNDLKTIFESVRWAQSSFNEQPWRYLIARKGSPKRKSLEELLSAGNHYAFEADILGVAFAKDAFSHNDVPNRSAQHDLGAANQILTLTAWTLGINARMMAGFDNQKARTLAPTGFDPMAMFVLGYATEKALKEGPGDRKRRNATEYVWNGEWEEPFFK